MKTMLLVVLCTSLGAATIGAQNLTVSYLEGDVQVRSGSSWTALAIGDTVLVYVLQPESPEGHAVLSLRRAGLERKWRAMQEQFEAGLIIEAPVIDHNKGGLIVDCGIRGFVPISQIVDFPRRPQNDQPRDAAQEIAEKLQPYVGEAAFSHKAGQNADVIAKAPRLMEHVDGALVGNEPGMTRDRLYARGEWLGRNFEVVDTGGIIPAEKDLIAEEIFRQALNALRGAAHLVMVVDARDILIGRGVPFDRVVGEIYF